MKNKFLITFLGAILLLAAYSFASFADVTYKDVGTEVKATSIIPSNHNDIYTNHYVTAFAEVAPVVIAYSAKHEIFTVNLNLPSFTLPDTYWINYLARSNCECLLCSSRESRFLDTLISYYRSKHTDNRC